MIHQAVVSVVVTIAAIAAAAAWMPTGVAVSVMVSGPNAVDRMKLPANWYLNATGDVYLVMQPDCILYTYRGQTAISKSNWTSWTKDHWPTGPSTNWNCYLDLQSDGNFVVYTWNGTYIPEATKAIWAADTGSAGYVNSTHRFVVLGSDGKLSMYGPDFSKLSMTTLLTPIAPGDAAPAPAPAVSGNASTSLTPNLAYPFPTKAAWKPNISLNGFPYLPAYYFLNQGHRLESSGGRFHLVLASDCTLKFQEIWPQNNSVKQVIWVPPGLSNTSQARRSCQLVLQPNGRLQVKSNRTAGTVYWTSTPVGNPAVNWALKLNDDRGGSLDVCDILDSNTLIWSSAAGTSSGNSTAWWWIVVGVCSAVLALLAAGFIFWVCYARDKLLDPVDKAFQRKMLSAGFSQVWYSENKIKRSTDNFSHKIGQGGFGDVFYGKLPDGQEIAAKVLSPESCQSKQEFYNEIELLSTVHHKYLVSLLGYRCTRRQQILIYEYLGGGDLRQKLQGEDARAQSLSWRQRKSILLEVAEGLEYLHDKCLPSIIHRDVKSTNILLTTKMVAKVADFGLSKIRALDQEDATHITTIVKGTPGYLDPEYHKTGMLTAKSDVFAFGIVVMEILTGQSQINIVQRVGDAWRSGKVQDLPDPNLVGDLDMAEFVKLVELSLWCARKRNEERPFMQQVVKNLRGIGLAAQGSSRPDIGFLDEDDGPMDADITSDSAPFSISSSLTVSWHSGALKPQQTSRVLSFSR